MTELGLFICTLLLLFFSSQLLTKALSTLLYRFFRSQKIVILLLALLLLPGVIIHELAHVLMAGLLFVKTGEIEFLPKIQGETVKLGSVQVAVTDPIRRALIGLAPMFVGLPLLLLALSYVTGLHFSWQREILFQYLLAGYGIFEIGNTLFSSKKDLEGTVELGLAVIAILLVCYFAGITVVFTFFQQLITPQISMFLLESSKLLLIPLGINVTVYLFSKLVGK